MEPEQAVPDLVHPRIVGAAEPPEPVAPFCDQGFPARGGELRRSIGLALSLAQEVARLTKEFPGYVVLLVSDPGVKVGVDPGPRMDPGQRSL